MFLIPSSHTLLLWSLRFGAQHTLEGCGIDGRVGDWVRGDERSASISSAIANDVYNRLCLWEGVDPGCLESTRSNKITKTMIRMTVMMTMVMIKEINT